MQSNVLDYFEATCARLPEHTAIVDRERSLSFSALRRAAVSLAPRLVSADAIDTRPIAVFLPKSQESIISFLAILYSANFYVPLDVKWPQPRLRSVLENLQPALIIARADGQAQLVAAGWPAERIVLMGENDALPSTATLEALAARRSALIDTDPVYIIYTSGSTGVPKGVVIPHRGVIDYIDWAREVYRVAEDEKIGSQAPFYFDNSTLDLYLSFSCGAALVLIPEELFSFPLKLIEYSRAAGVTTLFWVPSVMASVANFKIFEATALPPFRKILFAGEAMPTRTLNYWRRHFPQALFSNLYGPTEITVDCTYLIVDREFSDDEPLPIGIPCRNTDILILNEENRRAAPGQLGELCVRGSSLALGYWNAPDKTAAAFVQNPLHASYPERIYRTGDLVFTNERGEIIFVGRKDSQIKHQGYRIELGEIELAASGLPGVRNTCVLYHQAKKEITLFYESTAPLTPAVIRGQLSAKLPKYMLPTVFHHLENLPLNANGKIDRKALSDTLR